MRASAVAKATVATRKSAPTQAAVARSLGLLRASPGRAETAACRVSAVGSDVTGVEVVGVEVVGVVVLEAVRVVTVDSVDGGMLRLTSVALRRKVGLHRKIVNGSP